MPQYCDKFQIKTETSHNLTVIPLYPLYPYTLIPLYPYTPYTPYTPYSHYTLYTLIPLYPYTPYSHYTLYLCPQTPPLNFYKSLHPMSSLTSPTSPTPRIDHGKFYPGVLKKWLGLLIFKVRSPKDSLKISSGNSLVTGCVIPRLGPFGGFPAPELVGGFPALGTIWWFSRAWDQLEVFRRMGPVGLFRALGTSWTFSRAWRRSHVVDSSSDWFVVVFVIG